MRTPKPMPFNRIGSRPLRLLGLLLISMQTASCATPGNAPTRFVDTSCQAFAPITFSAHDTAATIAGIRAHNRVYDALCPPGAPA
jgi:hypothetical protein